jgi:hypothetical protein
MFETSIEIGLQQFLSQNMSAQLVLLSGSKKNIISRKMLSKKKLKFLPSLYKNTDIYRTK